MNFILVSTINGLSFSALLFLISIGFSLIFGLMRIINISHASLYLLGAYVGVSVSGHSGSFFLGIVAGSFAAAIVGFLQERFLLRKLHGKDLDQVLITVGLMFILDDIMLLIFGGYPLRGEAPVFLRDAVSFFGVTFPSYRLAMIVVGIISALIVWFLIDRTKFGATIRAGADNEEIANAIGININKVFIATFTLGSLLAGFGGMIGAPMLAVQSGVSLEILTLALVVVTVGGAGTVAGVAVGSLFVGLVDSFGRALFPSLSYFTMFLPMVLILVFRPQGLLGRSQNKV